VGIVLFLVAAVIASVGFAVWRTGRRSARARALAATAAQLGLDYSAVDLFDDAWQPFRLFGLGAARGVEDVCYGTLDGARVRSFDYWYRDEDHSGLSLGDGALAPDHRFSCAVVTLPASCPRLAVGRREPGDRLLELVGGDLVELELDAFNRRFAVRGEDRRFAVALLDQRMMEALLQLPDAVTAAVAEDRLLLIARELPPEGVARLLHAAARIQSAVPRVLSSLYPLRPGFDPGQAPPTRSPKDALLAATDAPEREDAAGMWWF
jgi:hypothetical protein